MRLASHGRCGLVREGIENLPVQNQSRFRRHGRVFLALALLGLGGLVLAGSLATRWHSSPTASRGHVPPYHLQNTDWLTDGDSRPGATLRLLPGLSWDEARKATAQARFRQDHWEKLRLLANDGKSVTLEGTARPAATRDSGMAVTPQVYHADAQNAVTIPEGRIRLVAIAGAWRQSPAGDEDTPAIYFDAIDGREWTSPNLPEALRRMRPVYDIGMRLRMLFEVEDDLSLDGLTALVFDARTHAAVGSRENWESFEPLLRDGRYLAVDFETAVWHDTPLEVMLDLASGNEQRQIVPATLPATLSFVGSHQRRIEVTQLATQPSFGIARESGSSTAILTWVLPAAPMTPAKPFSVWDLGNLLETDRLHLRFRPGAGAAWKCCLLESQTLAHPEMELVYRPETARCWFRVAGLPMAPNSRDGTRDLLDIRLPIPVDGIDYGWLAAVAQLELLNPDIYYAVTPLNPPLPDLTVREMLRMQAQAQGEQVVVDSKRLTISVHPKGPFRRWMDSVKRVWRERFP